MALTNLTIPRLATGYHNDIRYLTLQVTKAGGRIWKYKRNITPFGSLRFTIGRFPDMKVEDARKIVPEIDKQIANGIDPRKNKADIKANTFGDWAKLWSEYRHSQIGQGIGQRAVNDADARLNRWILPKLKDLEIKEIKTPEIYELLEHVVLFGRRETARKCNGIISQVYDFAILKGGADYNPTISLRKALPQGKVKPLAFLRDPREIGQLMRDIWTYEKGSQMTIAALRLSPYLMLRPKEVAMMKWEYIDFDKKQIEFEPEIMKLKRRHVVPLPRQAMEILEDLQLLTGDCEFVFPAISFKEGEHLSTSTVNFTLHRLGYKDKQTAHGFRHMAKTLLSEAQWDNRFTEKQLSHEVGANSSEITYNHAEFLPQRRIMLQAWADYLDGLRDELDFDVLQGIIKEAR